jgi:site-specific DNA-methyltransferase (adenine-specific)/modification methylase
MKVEIGNATLYLGDCMDILPTLPLQDLLLTDPPYGIGIGNMVLGNQVSHHGVTWDDSPPSTQMIKQMLKMTSWQCIWGGNYFDLPPTKCWLIWDKETAGVTSFADAEMAWTNFDKMLRLKRHLWSGPYMKVKEKREHPTQKPLAIIAWCIEQAPKNVLTILDPFMGSGTTGVAAIQLGRKFIGIEREPKYFEIACKRIEQAVAQGQLFEPEQQKQTQEAMF